MLRNFQNITVNNPDLIPSLKQFLSNSFDTALAHYYFSYFVQLGENEALKLLLQDPRVDPSTLDNFAIRLAFRECRIDTIKLLLKDSRVDPSDNDNEIIRWVYNDYNTELFSLIKNDPRVLAKSYKLGQNYHTEKQISELKKTHPYLFI